jgi:NAD(P)H-flavin reductase
MIQQYKLLEKINLTDNVFELVFEWESEIEMKPWYFITFLLDKIWGRAYSVLEIRWKNIAFIIKKREEIEWGRWWSRYICDLNIWESIKWVWPVWHFVLKENSNNKLFIWTGTWFVPLYNQIVWALDLKLDCKLKLIFWVREEKDLFYIEQLKTLKNSNSNFDYELYLSREFVEWTNKWYVTDYLTRENIWNFQEFYICWAPAMIDSSIELLKNNWADEGSIYYEKY